MRPMERGIADATALVARASLAAASEEAPDMAAEVDAIVAGDATRETIMALAEIGGALAIVFAEGCRIPVAAALDVVAGLATDSIMEVD